MPTGSQRQKGSTGLKALVLTGLLLLSGSTSASFIEHGKDHVIAEPKHINIPPSVRTHFHSYRSHGHRHRVRSYPKRVEGTIVEVPYTIWTGTFEELKKRVPQSTKDKGEVVEEDVVEEEEEEVTTKDTATKGTDEEEEEVKEEEVKEEPEEDDGCTGIVCQKGSYCTKSGCCPNGKICTGVTTCLAATDSQCPDNIACCPSSSPVCEVQGGKGVCVKNKKEELPTTTPQPPKSTSTSTPAPITKQDVTTSSILTTTQPTTTSSEPETTSTEEEKESSTSTSESTTSTIESTTTSALSSAPVPTDQSVATPSPDPVPVDVPSTTSAAPTPSATSTSRDLSDTSKIISGAVAGSIVALAFGTLIIYTIVKKRKENALARAEEASKAAPLAGTTSAAPMGSGGNGRPLSIQPEPEMLQMGVQPAAAVFTSGPQQGRSLREGIPPPSPPPNALVVGTPPYRRGDPFRGGPGTPTSLRAGFPSPQPQQAQWDPVVGEYPQNFPLPEGPLSPADYEMPTTYLPQVYTPATTTPPPGTYQAYSAPGSPR